jgi:choline dehydrogenase-like flavoprotein
VHVPRGQVVGGSSVTNGAVALRGHPEHYDQWERFVDGYGWETWLPWFRRIERDLDFGAEPWHGDAGPIPVSRYPIRGSLTAARRLPALSIRSTLTTPPDTAGSAAATLSRRESR